MAVEATPNVDGPFLQLIPAGTHDRNYNCNNLDLDR